MNEVWAFDPYEILGVRRGADDRTIASAYRTLARRFHPDIAGDAATVRMMRINAAFDAIRTARLRSEYDDATSGGSGAGGATGDGATGAARWARERDGTGGAGPAPGRPQGSVLDFGRHVGWSLGEVARVDPGYLDWLAARPDGRRYATEIDAVLKRIGYRPERQAASVRHTGRLSFRRG